MKQCSHCLRFLPDSRFALIRRKSGNQHRASWCHDCTNEGRQRESRWHITRTTQTNGARNEANPV